MTINLTNENSHDMTNKVNKITVNPHNSSNLYKIFSIKLILKGIEKCYEKTKQSKNNKTAHSINGNVSDDENRNKEENPEEPIPNKNPGPNPSPSTSHAWKGPGTGPGTEKEKKKIQKNNKIKNPINTGENKAGAEDDENKAEDKAKNESEYEQYKFKPSNSSNEKMFALISVKLSIISKTHEKTKS